MTSGPPASSVPECDAAARPITVAATRYVDASRAPEMVAWIRAGQTLAEGFPGFRGHGYVRSVEGDDAWHMLYRFADEQSLRAWEESSQRRWWLDSAQGMVGEFRVQRMSGIEGWFEPPAEHRVEYPGAASAPPPRWKQSIAIFSVFLPLSLALTALGLWLVPDWPILARTVLQIAIATPIMTYLALPWITGLLKPWLQAPRRRDRS